MIEMVNYKKELAARGLTVNELARRIGVSNTHISDVLSGKKQASPDTEKKIIEALEECPWCRRKWPHPTPIKKK